MSYTVENAPKPKRIKVFGGFVRMRRRTLGLSQRQIARALGYGDPASICAVEMGKFVMNDKYLPQLADLIHVNLFQLKQIFDLDLEIRNNKAEREAYK
jgi:transcriptional regulator with XRE-family HTH domain